MAREVLEFKNAVLTAKPLGAMELDTVVICVLGKKVNDRLRLACYRLRE